MCTSKTLQQSSHATSDSTRRSGCSSYRGPHRCNKDDGCKWAAGHKAPSKGNGELCIGSWCHGVCFNACSAAAASLKVDFTSTGITATVEVTQSSSDLASETAHWTATFEEFDSNLCPSGQLNWHVHQTPGSGLRNDDCDSAVTGGHYDPTFACGGASQNNGVSVGEALDEAGTDLKTFPNAPFPKDTPAEFRICSALRDYAGQQPYAEVCGPASQTKCEIGDQSGKMGKLIISKSGFVMN